MKTYFDQNLSNFVFETVFLVRLKAPSDVSPASISPLGYKLLRLESHLKCLRKLYKPGAL